MCLYQMYLYYYYFFKLLMKNKMIIHVVEFMQVHFIILYTHEHGKPHKHHISRNLVKAFTGKTFLNFVCD